MTQFNIQFNLPELLPRASWKFLFWLHHTLSFLLGQGFMAGQHLHIVLWQLEKKVLPWVTHGQKDNYLHILCITGHAQATISWCQSDLREKISV